MENEVRLIDANALCAALLEKQYSEQTMGIVASYYPQMRAIVANIPTADAVEVVHGRWEKHGKHDWRCSVCGIGVPYSFTGHSYCHNCGADMREGKTMTRSEEVEWLKSIKEKYIHGGDDWYDYQRRQAIDYAVCILENTATTIDFD